MPPPIQDQSRDSSALPCPGIFAMEFWVLLSAWLSLSGWLLSALLDLNRLGYSGMLLGFAALLYAWLKDRPVRCAPGGFRQCLHVWKRRFSRPLPCFFLAVALLVLVGGALYRPVNYDALTYRFPRVLNWVAAEHWHWIDSWNQRVNYSGTGFEWLMVPLYLFTPGDRFLFLANYLPYLLLPGASFCFLREMGARRRVAWTWMWLIPLGYCFALQAGGIGNDSYAAVDLLIAIAFALRARRSRRESDLWIALLAAALVTGSKVANVPLLLPVFAAAWPALPLLWKRPAFSLPLLAVCAMVSFLPLAVLNTLHTGKWTGDPANQGRMDLSDPAAALVGNAMQLTVHNLTPPVFPLTAPTKRAVAKLEAAGALKPLFRDYPRLGLVPYELTTEEGAGMGLGLTVLFLLSLGWCLCHRPWAETPAARTGLLVALCGWAALLAYMAKVGSEAAPRLVAAYYPLCISLVLIPAANTALIRRWWWKCMAAAAALSLLPALILSPSRPLWPANTLLSRFAASHPGNPLITRMASVYSVYAGRADTFAPLKRHFPPGVRDIGLISNGDDPSVSLWMPFGERRVYELTPENEARVLAAHPGILIVASADGIAARYGGTVEEWLARQQATVIASEKLTVKIQRGGGEEWFLIAPGKSAAIPPAEMSPSPSPTPLRHEGD